MKKNKKPSLFFTKIKGPKFYFWILGVVLTPIIALLAAFVKVKFDPSWWFEAYALLIFFWLIFSLFLTFRSINKVSTRFVVSIIQLIYQLAILLVPIIIFVLAVVSTAAYAPEFVKNNPNLEKTFIKRIENKYDIRVGENDKIKHISYWSVGEEFGFDMIIKAHDYNKENYLPKNSPLENATFSSSLTWHTHYLCYGEKLEIDDEGVRDIICDLRENPRRLEISTSKVRLDWKVTTTFFPEQNLVWIKETEW
jgi:hypothetical protein